MRLRPALERRTAAMAALALLATPSVALADDEQPTGPAQWRSGPMGKLYPVGGWKSCAEAAAHADVPMMKGDPGYNPAGSGFTCV